MILESRSIIFSDEELLAAFKPMILARVGDESLEALSVVPTLDEQGEVTVSFKVSDGSEIAFESGDVGPTILNHCIEVGIPLPRGSYKELAIRGDHVALIVRLETGVGVGIDGEDY